jgi:hypothetical protein
MAAIALCRLEPHNAWALEQAKAMLAQGDWGRSMALGVAIPALARMGPAAQPFAPVLHQALDQNPMDSGPDGPARLERLRAMAWTSWRIEGKADLALHCLRQAQRVRANAPVRNSVDALIIELARDFAESPEFCRAVRPVLEALKSSPEEYVTLTHADAFRRIDRTLEKLQNTHAQ